MVVKANRNVRFFKMPAYQHKRLHCLNSHLDTCNRMILWCSYSSHRHDSYLHKLYGSQIKNPNRIRLHLKKAKTKRELYHAF